MLDLIALSSVISIIFKHLIISPTKQNLCPYLHSEPHPPHLIVPPPPLQVPEQSPLNNEYYMLSLREGKLELRVNGGGGEAVLLAKRSFNDGRPYTVTVLKRRREYVLFS